MGQGPRELARPRVPVEAVLTRVQDGGGRPRRLARPEPKKPNC
jgi:hypothetical protein